MKGLCIAMAIAAFALCASFFPKYMPEIILWIKALGMIAPLCFLLLYCFATLFFLPTMVMTLAGGALFGPILGTVFNLTGATLGAAFAFLISRYWFCDWIAKRKSQNLHRLIAGVEKRGWQFVALLRIVPIIPFNVVNYGLGLTRIKFSQYLITTIVFLIPIEIFSTYCGYAGMDFILRSGLFYKQTLVIFFIIVLLAFVVFRLFKRRC